MKAVEVVKAVADQEPLPSDVSQSNATPRLAKEGAIRSSITVVIPTIGRPELRRAVESVLRQTIEAEIIVVFDGSLGRRRLSIPKAEPVRVLQTGRPEGGSAARMLGVRSSRSDYIAFLDDDDYWLPSKLETQLNLAHHHHRRPGHVVVAGRMLVRDQRGKAQLIIPRRLKRPGEPVGDYLFRRLHLRYGEGQLPTSTLLCDRALLDKVPWDPALRLHQDWDWMLRLGTRDDVAFAAVESPLSVVAETPGSVSRNADWRVSLRWAEDRRHLISDQAWADFLLSHPAVIARQAGAFGQSLKIAIHAVQGGQPSGKAILGFVLEFLLPAKLISGLSRYTQRGLLRSYTDPSKTRA